MRHFHGLISAPLFLASFMFGAALSAAPLCPLLFEQIEGLDSADRLLTLDERLSAYLLLKESQNRFPRMPYPEELAVCVSPNACAEANLIKVHPAKVPHSDQLLEPAVFYHELGHLIMRNYFQKIAEKELSAFLSPNEFFKMKSGFRDYFAAEEKAFKLDQKLDYLSDAPELRREKARLEKELSKAQRASIKAQQQVTKELEKLKELKHGAEIANQLLSPGGVKRAFEELWCDLFAVANLKDWDAVLKVLEGSSNMRSFQQKTSIKKLVKQLSKKSNFWGIETHHLLAPVKQPIYEKLKEVLSDTAKIESFLDYLGQTMAEEMLWLVKNYPADYQNLLFKKDLFEEVNLRLIQKVNAYQFE